jgi:hypothetical protein
LQAGSPNIWQVTRKTAKKALLDAGCSIKTLAA